MKSRVAFELATVAMLLVIAVTSTLTLHAITRQNRLEHGLRTLEVQNVLNREQICSLSRSGPTCRALFERLAAALNHEQRHRLACAVVAELPGTSAVKEIRRRASCR